MAIRLLRHLNIPRDIDVGYGVSIRVMPFSYADYRECEAAAMRQATEGMSQADAIEMDSVDFEEVDPRVQDGIQGRYSKCLLQVLLVRFGDGWTGIQDENGKAAPMNADTVEQFFDLFPAAGQMVLSEVVQPYQVIASEGNVSAPLPNTA
ncbi:MAG: hypothetical protein AAGL89_16050 [Pseudomonadota bacterium]